MSDGKTREIPELSNLEIAQLMAAQRTVMDHHEELDEEYLDNLKHYAEVFGVELPLHYYE